MEKKNFIIGGPNKKHIKQKTIEDAIKLIENDVWNTVKEIHLIREDGSVYKTLTTRPGSLFSYEKAKQEIDKLGINYIYVTSIYYEEFNDKWQPGVIGKKIMSICLEKFDIKTLFMTESRQMRSIKDLLQEALLGGKNFKHTSIKSAE